MARFKLLLTILILISSLPVFSIQDTVPLSDEGREAGNGGDRCEQKFKLISANIDSWLSGGNVNKLKLPQGITHDNYKNEMQKWISSAKVICTDKQVSFSYVEKECRNSKKFEDIKKYLTEDLIKKISPKEASKETGWIICNRDALMRKDQTNIYPLVAHEYAGLAGFEKNDGQISSSYKISNQYVSFQEEIVSKVLATNMIPPNVTEESFFQVIKGQSFYEVKKMLIKLERDVSSSYLTVTERKNSIELIIDPSKSSFCPNDGNNYACYAFIKIGFTEFENTSGYDVIKVSVQRETRYASDHPVKDAFDVCQQDRDYCPRLDVDIKTFSGSRNKIEFEWEAQSKSDPGDDSFGFTFYYNKGKNFKPMWRIVGWIDGEDSGYNIFDFTSHE